MFFNYFNNLIFEFIKSFFLLKNTLIILDLYLFTNYNLFLLILKIL